MLHLLEGGSEASFLINNEICQDDCENTHLVTKQNTDQPTAFTFWSNVQNWASGLWNKTTADEVEIVSMNFTTDAIIFSEQNNNAIHTNQLDKTSAEPTALVVMNCTGTGTVVSNVDVPDAANATGVPDATLASLFQSNDAIVLDLGEALAATTTITITYQRISGSTPILNIQASSSAASGFTDVAESPYTITTAQNVTATFTVTVPAGNQYLEIESDNGIDAGIDGITFTCPISCTGEGTVISNVGVPDATNADGAQDGSYASLHETNDEIILDLGEALSSTTDVDIIWRRTSGSQSEIAVSSSAAPASGFTAVGGSPFTITTQNVVLTQTVSVPAGDRYLRILSNNGFDLGVDAILFTCPTSGGGNNGGLTANLSCSAGATEITGTIFEDFNYNGTYDSEENLGIEDVIITATDSLGNSSTTMSASDGTFTLGSLTVGRTYRIEFTNIPNWAFPTTYGGDNGTSVQFVQPSNCANLGVASPSDYCQENPFLMVPCYVRGGGNGMDDVMVRWSYDNSGFGPDDKIVVSRESEVGALWGMAYSPSDKIAYTSSVLKTHAKLHEGVGGGGIDALFTIDPFSPTNGTLWLELQDDLGINVGQSLIPNNATRGLNSTVQHDDTVYPLVGTVGIGDIDISDDNDTLFVVNLYNKKLYSIDIAAKTVIDSFPVPDPGCSNGTYRPWAVEYHKGKVYVGSICDGSTAGKDATATNALTNTLGRSDLHAYVYRLDGSSFTTVLDFPLDYEKRFNSDWADHQDVTGWFPWTSDVPHNATTGGVGPVVSYPTPLLSDIVFDDNGDMVLGFVDRTGFQLGDANYSGDPTTGTDLYTVFAGGDILRACSNSGTWLIEGAANSCTNSGGHALGTGTSIYGSGVGEYYEGEFFDNDNPIAVTFSHPETAIGSMVLLRGKGEVITTAYDPLSGGDFFKRGGIIRLNNASGDYIDGFQVYDDVSETFGKGVGLGDLIAVCDPAPIEIGNFVWIDTDGDGEQDAGELGIEGVRMELYDAAGNLLAIDSTNSLGQYYFSGNGIDDADWQTTDDTLQSNTSYYIVAGGNGQFASNEITLNGTTYNLTASNSASGANADNIDSDGTIASGVDSDFDGEPYISNTSGALGEVNHSFDFGFKLPCNLELSYSQSVCTDNNDGTFTATYDLILTWAGPPTGSDVTLTHAGDGTLTTTAISAATIAAGSSTTLSSALTVPADGNGTTMISAAFNDETTCNAEFSFKAPVPCPTDVSTCASTSGCIGGNVFEDFNCNGADDTNEPGVQGVQAQIYDCNNNLVGTGYSDTEGDWQVCGLTDGTAYRVEFLLPESVSCWAAPTHVAGSGNQSDVQFLTAPACTQFSVSSPADYCQADPEMAIICYENGDGSTNNNQALVTWTYSDEGQPMKFDGTSSTPNPSTLASIAQLGTVWGTMYEREEKRIYTTAALKRHVSLGPLGLGGVYIADANGYVGSFNLQGVTPANGGSTLDFGSINRTVVSGGISTGTAGDYQLSQDPDEATVDLDAFGKVGKTGMGDTDLSEDGRYMWTVNLNDGAQSLIKIDLKNPTHSIPTNGSTPNGAIVDRYLLSDMSTPSCTNGVFRAWGLSFHKGVGYLGGVCSAENGGTAADLKAYVLSFDPNNPTGGLSEVLSFDLDFTRELKTNFFSHDEEGEWRPWTETWSDLQFNDNRYLRYTSPILTDIEFT
ncbi:MAG: SdrD B-like domain-containing protein, partial [Saprospiraceae bacterium]